MPRHRLPAVAGVLVLAACGGGEPPSRPARATVDHVGPGPVARTMAHGEYRVTLRLTPNRPAVRNRVSVRLTRRGRPVAGAKVTASLTMVEMDMGTSASRLRERSTGRYAGRTSALIMAGDWRLGVEVRPRSGAAFTVHVVDRAGV